MWVTPPARLLSEAPCVKEAGLVLRALKHQGPAPVTCSFTQVVDEDLLVTVV